MAAVSQFECTCCRDVFYSQSTLDEHIASRHVQCHLCKRPMNNRNDLVQHIDLTHYGLRPHECPECGKRFRVSSYVTNHIRTVHRGERRFKCSECDVSCSTLDNLKGHISTSHEHVRPNTCTNCRRCFFKKDILRRHYKECKKTPLLEAPLRSTFCSKKTPPPEASLRDIKSALGVSSPRKSVILSQQSSYSKNIGQTKRPRSDTLPEIMEDLSVSTPMGWQDYIKKFPFPEPVNKTHTATGKPRKFPRRLSPSDKSNFTSCCQDCNQLFTMSNELSAVGQLARQCLKCGATFQNYAELYVHITTNHHPNCGIGIVEKEPLRMRLKDKIRKFSRPFQKADPLVFDLRSRSNSPPDMILPARS